MRTLRKCPTQAAADEFLGDVTVAASGFKAPQQQHRHLQQVLVLEIQDRFGCLFLDFKGSPRACFMFGALKQSVWALRGVLMGIFVGGPVALASVCCE